MKQKRLHVQILAASSLIAEYDEFEKCVVFVGNLFTFNLPPVLIERTQKLLIELSDEIDAEFIFPKETGESIYTIQETFVLSSFNMVSSSKKIAAIAETAYRCLLKLYKHLGLNLSDVELAYRNINGNDFKLVVKLCGGVKQNRNKKIAASIIAKHFLDYALIQITFLDNDNRVMSEVDLFKTVPVYFMYTQLASSARWINNEVFAISNNSKEFTICVNVNGSCEINYSPKMRNIQGIKEEIRFLTKELLIDI